MRQTHDHGESAVVHVVDGADVLMRANICADLISYLVQGAPNTTSVRYWSSPPLLGPNRRDEAVDDLPPTAWNVADPFRLTLPRSQHRACKACHGAASSTRPCGSRMAPGTLRFGNTASQFGMQMPSRASVSPDTPRRRGAWPTRLCALVRSISNTLAPLSWHKRTLH